MPNLEGPIAMAGGKFKYRKYTDATYEYHCFADPGTALATERWSIMRVTTASGAIDWAAGTNAFVKAATDLTAVQGHSYS
jgi:hypothetical protein